MNVLGCPVQPDNITETPLYLLFQAAGLSPMIPLDEAVLTYGRTARALRQFTQGSLNREPEWRGRGHAAPTDIAPGAPGSAPERP